MLGFRYVLRWDGGENVGNVLKLVNSNIDITGICIKVRCKRWEGRVGILEKDRRRKNK